MFFAINNNNNNNNNKNTYLVITIILFSIGNLTHSQFYEDDRCTLSTGKIGICKSIENCKWIINGLRGGTLTYSEIQRCSFEGFVEIICCPIESVQLEKPFETNTIDNINRSENDVNNKFSTIQPNTVKLTVTSKPPLKTTSTTIRTTINNGNTVFTNFSVPPDIFNTLRNNTDSNVIIDLAIPKNEFGHSTRQPPSTVKRVQTTSKPNEWIWTSDVNEVKTSTIVIPKIIPTTTERKPENRNIRTSTTTSTTTKMPAIVTATNFQMPPVKRISEIACENYSNNFSTFTALSFHIIGGQEADVGEFPHMAALGYESSQFGRSYDFRCGGSVINDEYILTAAHCVGGRDGTPNIVRLGKIALETDDGKIAADYLINETYIFNDYVRREKYHDIALLRVTPPIKFTEIIHPACLRTNISDIDINTELIVTGWGIMNLSTYQTSDILLKTNLTAFSLDKCNASLLEYDRNSRALPNGIKMGQICASDPNAKQDACQGDSGGPIQTILPNGMATIVGITSFGINCGTALPSVYTRVAFYVDWIESIAWSKNYTQRKLNNNI